MKKILLAIMALAVSITAVSGQKMAIQNDCPTLTLDKGDLLLSKMGDGNLYRYDDRAHAQGYRHIYYLFTDHDTVYIQACSSVKQNTSSYKISCAPYKISCAPQINGKLFSYTTIKEDDKRSYWMVDGVKQSDRSMNTQKLNNNSVCLVRQHGQRAKVLLGVAKTGRGIEKDSNVTIYLLVMPKPSADAITCELRDSRFSFFGNRMSDTLQVHRSGRYVFDSIYVEGKPLDTAHLHYHGRKDHRDTPFYQDSYATAELTIDDLPLYYLQSAVTVSVYYRYLAPNGNIENGKTDIQVRIGRLRYLKLYILIGLLAAGGLFWLVRMLVAHKGGGSNVSQDELQRLKFASEENEQRKQKIQTLENEINRLKKLPKSRKAVDGNEFNAKCEEVKTKLDNLYAMLKDGKCDLATAAESVRVMENEIHNIQNGND